MMDPLLLRQKKLRTDRQFGAGNRPGDDDAGLRDLFKGSHAYKRGADLPGRLRIDSFGSTSTVHVKNEADVETASSTSLYSTDLLHFGDGHSDLGSLVDSDADLAQLKELHAELAAALKTARDKQTDFINKRYDYDQKTKEKHEPIKSPLDLVKRIAGGFSSTVKAIGSFMRDPAAHFRSAPEPSKPPALPTMDDGTIMTVDYVLNLEKQVDQLADTINQREFELELQKPVRRTHDDIIKELAAAPYLSELPVEQRQEILADWERRGIIEPEDTEVQTDENLDAPPLPQGTQRARYRPQGWPKNKNDRELIALKIMQGGQPMVRPLWSLMSRTEHSSLSSQQMSYPR